MHCKPEAALLGFLALFMPVLVPYVCAHKTRPPRALTALMIPPAPALAGKCFGEFSNWGKPIHWGSQKQRDGESCRALVLGVLWSSAWGVRPPRSNQCLVPLTPMGWTESWGAAGEGTRLQERGFQQCGSTLEPQERHSPKSFPLLFSQKKTHDLFFCLISVRELITLGLIRLFLLTWLVNQDSVT